MFSVRPSIDRRCAELEHLTVKCKKYRFYILPLNGASCSFTLFKNPRPWVECATGVGVTSLLRGPLVNLLAGRPARLPLPLAGSGRFGLGEL